MAMLALYVYAVQKNDRRWIAATFFLCGLCANYYSICFVHLVATLGLAEVLRQRKLPLFSFACALLFLVAAAPALRDLFSKAGTWAPVDLEIMRKRNSFMLASPFLASLTRYLRVFIVQTLLTILAGWVIHRYGDKKIKSQWKVWFPILLASFGIAVVGLVLEAQTQYMRFFFSRTSLFFTVGSMIFTVAGLDTFFRAKHLAHTTVWVVLLSTSIFLIQSRAVGTWKYLRDLRNNREQKEDFFRAIDTLQQTTPPSALILAPSPEMADLAASLRTYANREIYVSYKDGGVSLVDGARARNWLARYLKQENTLASKNPARFAQFMKDEGIDYAFLPSSLAASLTSHPSLSKIASSTGFEIWNVEKSK
jgi:hypothetical protein